MYTHMYCFTAYHKRFASSAGAPAAQTGNSKLLLLLLIE